MKELNINEVDAVNGGRIVKVIAEAIIASGVYDLLKSGVDYYHKNSYMGRGQFPSVPRAGHE